MTSTTGDIPAYNFNALRESIDLLNRRAERLGCEPMLLRIVREFEVERRSPTTGIKYKQKRYEIEIVGESPRFDGWTLLAVVETLPNGENLVRTVPGRTVPEAYRTTDHHCDHCKSDRRRKEVFILGHEDGRFAQVGRQCIADFLGNVSAETLIGRMAWLSSLSDAVSEAGSDDYLVGRNSLARDISEFLATVAIVIRRLGWKSRKMVEGTFDQTTADTAWWIITDYKSQMIRELIEKHDIHAEERDETLAQEALDWARALPTVGVSDYEFNLGVACRQDFVSLGTKGLVASTVSAYLRHLDRQEELRLKRERRPVSKHVGEIGVRQGFAGVEVTRIRFFEGDFGVRTMVQFADAEGNTLVWWASNEPDWAEGDRLDITGTVAKHDDYNGYAQTQLKRVVTGLPKTKKASRKSA